MNKFMFNLTSRLTKIFLNIGKYFNKINDKWYEKYEEELTDDLEYLKEQS